jgi:hypothetical protein
MLQLRFPFVMSVFRFSAPRILAGLLLPSLLLIASAHAATPVFLEDEAETSTNVSFGLPAPDAKKLSLVFDWQNERNFYALEADAKTVTFSITQNGQKRALASSTVKWAAKNAVVLQRRPWLMQLVVNDIVVLRAFDPTWPSGKIGTLSSTWNPIEPRVQPLETVRFDDDFTRAGQEGDAAWKTERGKWTLSASSESISAKNASMSSNPFAYEVEASTNPSLVTGGRRFWDSYDARASVKPEARGEIGLAAYVKDAQNYLAFRWSSEPGAKSRTLVRVQNGRETVLASAPGAWLPRQWYRLGMRVSPGYVEAIVDGVPILRAKNEFLGPGRSWPVG